MQIHEITEAWYNNWSSTLDNVQKLKSTQAQRSALAAEMPRYSSAGQPQTTDPRYLPGHVLPDPDHVLMVELPNSGRYFKDLKNIWYNQLWQPIPPAQSGELEKMITMDRYTQISDPRISRTPAPARQPVNRRTKVAPR